MLFSSHTAMVLLNTSSPPETVWSSFNCQSCTELLCPSPNFPLAGTSVILQLYQGIWKTSPVCSVFGLQSFDLIPRAMDVFMVLRYVIMAGKLLRTALTNFTWHAHLVVESCTSSDGFTPSCFWTSTNLL